MKETQTAAITDPLHVLIVDDEHDACKRLAAVLGKFATQVTIAGIAHNTKEAETLINDLQPQAIFLDINMPGEHAFHFLDRIKPVDFEIVFVTAYDEFALRALKLSAVDYILKPISEEEIGIAVKRLAERMKFKVQLSNAISYRELHNQTEQKVLPSKITFRDNNVLELVDLKDIYYVEAKGSYSEIVFKKGSVDMNIVMSHSISEYEDLLPEDVFYRVHKSYLVNCQHIGQVSKDNNYQVIVAGKYTLPIGRRRYSDMMDFLKANTFTKYVVK